MKIGISSPYLDSLAGGERYMLTIASCLSKKHRVDVFWPNMDIIERAKKRFNLDLDGVSVNASMQIGKISRIKHTFKYDVIIYLSDGSVPISLAKHNIFHFQVPFTSVNGRSLSNQLKLKRFNHFVCNSEFTKKYIDQEFAVNSSVIYPPVNTTEFKAGKKQNTILTVGRFHPLKKQDVLIDTFISIQEKLGDWQFVIAGGLLEQDKSYYQALVAKCVGNNIKLLPNISHEDLTRLYEETKIYWHGTGYGEKNPENMEHFGITTVEAMASGCIPVAFKGGGQKEIINDKIGGYLWDTTDELVKYTQELAGSTELWEKLSKQSKQDAVKYSEAEFCKNWQELIERL